MSVDGDVNSNGRDCEIVFDVRWRIPFRTAPPPVTGHCQGQVRRRVQGEAGRQGPGRRHPENAGIGAKLEFHCFGNRLFAVNVIETCKASLKHLCLIRKYQVTFA